MKKMIAFGTAASLFAMSAVVVGAASTMEKTSLGIKLDSGSLDDLKAGDVITVAVYTENAGGPFAIFSLDVKGLEQVGSPSVSVDLVNLTTDDSFNITTSVGNVDFKFASGATICTITYRVVDPAAVSITLVPDGEYSTAGATTILQASASGSDDSSSDDSSSDSDSSTDDSSSDSDSSTDDSSSDSDSSTDDSSSDSDSSTDDSSSDSDSSTDDSSSDSDSSTDDSSSDSDSSTDDSNSDSDTSTDDSSDSGTSSGSSSGSKDPGNVDTGIGFVLAPAILAGAALIISKKRK